MNRVGSEKWPRCFVLGGLLGFAVAGCDVPAPAVLDPVTPTGAPTRLATSVPSGRAVIVLLRGREYMASVNAWRVSVNGTPVADIDIGMRHRQVVAPGVVELSAEVVPSIDNIGLGLLVMEKPTLTINARVGELYVVELDPAFAGGPALRRRDRSAVAEAAGYIDAPLPAR